MYIYINPPRDFRGGNSRVRFPSGEVCWVPCSRLSDTLGDVPEKLPDSRCRATVSVYAHTHALVVGGGVVAVAVAVVVVIVVLVGTVCFVCVPVCVQVGMSNSSGMLR